MIKSTLSLSDSEFFLQKFDGLQFATEPGNTRIGRPPRLSSSEIIAGLAWHVMQPGGTFANHVAMLTGQRLSESALSERRQSLGTAPWLDALGLFLNPVADQHLHPHAFYKGLRLVGVDGTSLSVANTPSIKSTVKKTKSRRGKAAFFRIGCVAAVELGTHFPLALRIGENGESEGVLAVAIISVFNENDLLIGDRYYGSGKWVVRLMTSPGHPRFLIRVKECLCSKTYRVLADGSRLVEIRDPDSGEFVTVREIRAKVRRVKKNG